ncbi:hypothetical protein COT62_03720 [Candidatus Roizmanbacteria bacterium CG09_land_8_20_14_0_10_41_9]|uniref:Uncharacterized protein n=1 Tax=Candidatus Roizmanbacteria bacterium CG09_land_8_20_14_0_10_41_9 TaxID=1974850 RepID=A0A2H0WS15_9BACT|nr:MAG: hypothetical protein COT62_03720 [Candidatus Roizmanbacteria bacterium CG09_land_8_20_14_0_10_41_9]
MQKAYKNVCCRCGKERIVKRVWKERIGNSVVENTETVCPDKECQKIVDRDLKKQKNKRLQMEKRKEESLRKRKKKPNTLPLKRKYRYN